MHALATLNDVQYVEAARLLAQRVLAEAKSPDERLDLMLRIVLARRPTQEERTVLSASLDRLEREYSADAAAAQSLLSAGESPRNEQLDPARHAALTALCLALLNLDEALSKE